MVLIIKVAHLSTLLWIISSHFHNLLELSIQYQKPLLPA